MIARWRGGGVCRYGFRVGSERSFRRGLFRVEVVLLMIGCLVKFVYEISNS